MLRNGQGSFEIEIREVVHLSHEQLPIEEIQEMELVPQIESREFGDHIEIIGCLYLFGDYKGNQEAGRLDPAGELPESYEESVQFEPLSADRGPFSPLARQDRFEYRIPVRISLPRGKVRNVEDVYAHINAFDYELRSPYQIEVAASLMINGLVDQEEEIEEKNKTEDQYEFVHMANPSEDQVADPFSDRLLALEQQVLQHEEEQDKQERGQEQESTESHDEPRALSEDQEEAVEDEREADKPEEIDNVIVLPRSHEPQEERPSISAEIMEAEEEAEEEVKVAISNKGSREDQEPISSLSSFLSNRMKREEQAAKQRAEQQDDAETREEKTNEALYLTNFMESSTERFTKLKICILQKNETLEEVAERYHLSVDHILRANQAVRNQVAAGQLLYIPVKG